MTATTTGGQGQAPAAETPGQGQAPAGQQDPQGTETGQAPGTQTPGSAQFDPATIQDPAARAYLEKLDHELREARTEAARYRTERGTLAEQVQQYQRQNETAEQAAQREAAERQQRLDALERENRDLKVGGAITSAATTAGALNAQTVWDLIQARGMTVETDDKGKPTNTAKLLADLRKSDPYLFRQTPTGADAGAGRGRSAAPVGGSINDALRGVGSRSNR